MIAKQKFDLLPKNIKIFLGGKQNNITNEISWKFSLLMSTLQLLIYIQPKYKGHKKLTRSNALKEIIEITNKNCRNSKRIRLQFFRCSRGRYGKNVRKPKLQRLFIFIPAKKSF